MLQTFKNGQTSVVLRVKLLDSSVATGAGLTGLTFSSSGLRIGTIADNEATATAYTVAGSTIETITTLGTYAAPTATKCRFKEVDATNHPGVYEIQLADARLAVSSAKSLLVSVSGATNLAQADLVIQLQSDDPYIAKPTNFNLQSIDASGRVDVIKIAGTTQTARDIGASVLLSTGTGTGQLDFTSGVVKCNNVQWLGGTIPAVNVTGVPLVDAKYLLGTAFSTPTVAGVPNVNVKTWNDLTTVALPLVPTTAGRTLDVSTGGEAGVDWANVGSPTTAVSLTGTTIATTQKVDIETIKTNPVVNAGTVTFPTTATLASTTNITAGTMTSVTSVTNAVTVGTINTDVITSTALAASAVTEIQTGLSTAAALATAQSDVTAIKAKTDSLTFTSAGFVDANVQKINDVTITGNGSSGNEFNV